eukprot:TRINITY_DN21711_c0_g3_i1.p1 TRINITY_DN21711_c0_g3~~TRINITY_DN21711_c0_g3_i1.p1  ORF type:complete len:526 (-),score=76.50 TRINITY_DN21711_c0_g3_i1:223-1800(-)
MGRVWSFDAIIFLVAFVASWYFSSSANEEHPIGLPIDIDLWGPHHVLQFLEKNEVPEHSLRLLHERIHVESWNEVDGPKLLQMKIEDLQKDLNLATKKQAGKIRKAISSFQERSKHEGLQSSAWKNVSSAAGSDRLWADDVIDRINATLWGIFMGDALSMPAHWYYDLDALRADFGTIEGYVAPKKKHETNGIMAGHWQDNKCNIRDLQPLLHLSKKPWSKPGYHYHGGKKAGENTLDALLKILLLKSLAGRSGYDPKDYVSKYVSYMTTPKTHNDSYLNIPHRQFLYNWLFEKCKKDDPETCAGEENHSTASINGLVHLPALFALALAIGTEDAMEAALKHARLFFKSERMAAAARAFGELLFALWKGQNLEEVLDEVGNHAGINLPWLVKSIERSEFTDDDVADAVGLSCYTYQAFPLGLYIARRHSSAPSKPKGAVDAKITKSALLANTNMGGENCFRGSLVGAIMGAAGGSKALPEDLVHGLAGKSEIGLAIDRFLEHLKTSSAQTATATSTDASHSTVEL